MAIQPKKLTLVMATVLVLGVAFLLRQSPRYLSNRPEACLGCHVMQAPHQAWSLGPHAKVAVCNECHVPHGGGFRALAFKAWAGVRHGAVLAVGATPSRLRIRPASAQVVKENCLRCHGGLVEIPQVRFMPRGDGEGEVASQVRGRGNWPRPRTAYHADPRRNCMECHRGKGHGGLKNPRFVLGLSE